MIPQFSGESRKDAIINHFSLDIEEENGFFKYIEFMGYTVEADDEKIESLHAMWDKHKNN